MNSEQGANPESGHETVEKRLGRILEAKLEGAVEKTIERLLLPVARLEEISRKKYLTEIEVGALYSIPPATLRTERCRGRGPKYVKDGKRVLYSQAELQAYFEKRSVSR